MATDPAAYELGIKFSLSTEQAIQDLGVLETRVNEIFAKAASIKMSFDPAGLAELGKATKVAAGMGPGDSALEKAAATEAVPPSPQAIQIAGGAAPSVPNVSALSSELKAGAITAKEFEQAMDKLDESYDTADVSAWKLTRATLEMSEAVERHVALRQKLDRQFLISESEADALAQSGEHIRDVENKISEGIKKHIETIGEFTKDQKTAIDFGLQQNKVLREETQLTNNVVKTIINKGHATRFLSAATQSLASVAGSAGAGMNALSASIRTGIVHASVFHALLPLIQHSLQELITIQDQYAKANFRAAGSVTELMNTNTDLQGKLALTSSEAQATIAAVAGAGINAKEGFAEAAKSVKQFSVVTGASEQAVARFAKVAIVATGSIGQTTKVLGTMVGMMRASGMSSADMDNILGKLEKQLIGVRGAFGTVAAKHYAETMALAAATAKKLGLEADDLTKILEGTRDPVSMLEDEFFLLHAQAGNLEAAFDGTLDPMVANQNAMNELANIMEQVSKENPGRPFEQMIQLQALTGSQNKEWAARMIGSFKDAGGGAAEWLKKQKEVADEAQKNADLQKEWEEATNTLIASIKKLILPIIALISKAMIPLMGVLEKITPIINVMIDAFGWLVDKFNAIDAASDGWVSAIMGWGVALYFVYSYALIPLMAALTSGTLISGFMNLVKWPVKAAQGLFGLGKAAVSAATGLAPAANAMNTAGTSAASLGGTATPTLGQKIASFFRGLASGLRAMADPKVLLGMVAVVVGLGALAFILVKLVENLKGFELTALAASVAMIGMAFAFYLLAPAVVALAGAAVVGFVPLAGLALVMLGMGAAALMVAYGMSLVIDSFTGLFAVLTMDNAAAFLVLAAGLTALGLAIGLMAPIILAGLLALSFGFLAAWGASKTLDEVNPSLMALAQSGAGLESAGRGVQLFADHMGRLGDIPIDKFDRATESITRLSHTGFGLKMAGEGMGLLADNIAKINAIAPVKFPIMDNKDEQNKRIENQKIDMADKTNKKLDNILGKISEERLDALMRVLEPALDNIISKLDKDKSLSTDITQW